MSLPIHGFLLADKPAGISSFGVVGGVRAALGGRLRGPSRLRAGHAGTLDPMATGLLLVLCGAVTRLQPYLVGHDKRYRAVVRLGAGTDSHDRDGEPVGRAAVDCDMDDVTAALAAFRGRIEQRPPRISALKRDGRALYALARRGEAPRQEPRPVLIRRIEAAPLRWGEPAADDPLAADDGRVYVIYDFQRYRDKGIFYESLTNDILDDLSSACQPRWMKVTARFSPRGGITTDVVAEYRAED